MFRSARIAAWVVMLSASLIAYWSATPLKAQYGALNELYGEGVHAYFAGDHGEAHALLSKAIDSGSQDPRAYYFRGLAHLKLGRDPEARDDFAEGARLEVADADRFYNVSKSLERVQGRNRLLLERYRSDARLLAFQDLERRRFDRYERIRRAEPDVLLRPTPSDSVAPPPAAPDELPAEEMPEDGLPDEPAEEMPDEDLPDEPAGDEPAEDVSEAETPADDDPFGVDELDADDPPAEEPPADDAEEPAADEAPPDPDDETSAAPADKAPAGVVSTLGGAFMRALNKVSKQASAARTASRPAAPPAVLDNEVPDDELPDDVFVIDAPEADGDQPPQADTDFPEADTDDPFGEDDASAEPEDDGDADDDPFGN
ncbi:MAG: tetratricopeptide repeat protein [Pirellulales bacterium]